MLTCVTDLAFGDTGKGKIVDYIAHDYDVLVRFNGGPNAGHTIVVDGQKYSFHNLPSGIFSEKPPSTLVLSGGMVINPVSLADEIRKFQGNIKKLILSSRIHCIMPWHVAQDHARATAIIGTTGQGIGPCYAEKMNRMDAIRLGSLLDSLDLFSMDDKDKAAYMDAANFLSDFIGNDVAFLRKSIKENKNILFESANGIHLDIDHGDYPFVTSSGCGPAYIPQSCGLPNVHLDRIIGITKAYTTRVGKGLLPTEIEDGPMGDLIREIGNEYGTTTGRPRRIGWLDLDVVKEGAENTGATEIAITHIDTLALACQKAGRKNFICKMDNAEILFEIWDCNLAGWDCLGHNPLNGFLTSIEDFLGLPVTMLGVGRDRKNIIEV